MEPILKHVLTRPTPAPKASGVIVTCAAQQVAEGVKCQGPDVGVVRVLELFLGRAVGHGPVDDGTL